MRLVANPQHTILLTETRIATSCKCKSKSSQLQNFKNRLAKNIDFIKQPFEHSYHEKEQKLYTWQCKTTEEQKKAKCKNINSNVVNSMIEASESLRGPFKQKFGTSTRLGLRSQIITGSTFV